MTQRIVINRCFGGFGLSDAAYERLIELGMKSTTWKDGDSYENPDAEIVDWKASPIENRFSSLTYSFVSDDEGSPAIRCHPLVLQVVEGMGEKANGFCAELETVEVPDGVEWTIEEYDGREWVAEKHRTWR